MIANSPNAFRPYEAAIIARAIAPAPAISAATEETVLTIDAGLILNPFSIQSHIFTTAALSNTSDGAIITKANAAFPILVSIALSISGKPLNASIASFAAQARAPAAPTIAATTPAVSATVERSNPKDPIIKLHIFTTAAPRSTKTGPINAIAATCINNSLLNSGIFLEKSFAPSDSSALSARIPATAMAPPATAKAAIAPAVCNIVDISRLKDPNIFLDKKTIAAPKAIAPNPKMAIAAALFAISFPLDKIFPKSNPPTSGASGIAGPLEACCSLLIMVLVFFPFCMSDIKFFL